MKRYLLNDSIAVTVIDSKKLLDEAARLHGLTPLSAAVLGRLLTVGVFFSLDLKNAGDRLSIVVKGGGAFIKAVIASDSAGVVKGYIQNPSLELPLKDGRLDIAGAVGRNGSVSVIKDLGLKEPYIGASELVTGDIAGDFSAYFTFSEQKPSAIALGEYYDGHSITAAGGIFVQCLPGTNDFLITAVQDVLREFTDTGRIFAEYKTQDAIMNEFFSSFDVKAIDERETSFFCGCNSGKVEDIVRLLGLEEAERTVKEQGKIEVVCWFCGRRYNYGAAGVKTIFEEKRR